MVKDGEKYKDYWQMISKIEAKLFNMHNVAPLK